MELFLSRQNDQIAPVLDTCGWHCVVTPVSKQHIAENKTGKFEQAGFTNGGNILDNLFILRECVEETYRKKELMVAIAIDF